MFSKEQNELLAAPLKSSNIKQRKQGWGNVSYIESWHVIAEANRIFGFDGWSSETLECKCVAERERAIGKEGEVGWCVTYIATVRITAGGIFRDGNGCDHGIDRDLGQAHEGAFKKAASDARKRALMTFGDQFGLALYDKTQENVVSDAPAAPVVRKAPPPPAPNVLKSVEPTEAFKKLDRHLAEAAERGPEVFQKAYDALTDEQYAMMKSAIERRHHPRALEVGAMARS